MWAGLIIGLGLVLILRNLEFKYKLWMTSNQVTADIALFIIVTIIHGMIGGGVEGVVHAAVASGVLSVYISILRKRIGFKDSMGYNPGTENHDNEI